MPELPEVEHARASLARWLVGRSLTSVEVLDARLLDAGQTAARLARTLAGREVSAVDRRGKWLRIGLDRGRCFSHLGMTGKWAACRASDQPAGARLVLQLATGRTPERVVYIDPRLFGRFVVADGDIPEWAALGPDPLLDGIDARALHAALARRRSPVKVALLDQALLAGIGNIQATEALFIARIDPRRVARSLSLPEARRLAAALLQTLRATLASQADEGLTYLSEGGDNPFTVYGREGTPCPCCRATLAKIVLAGRGTVFCAKCQRGGGS